MDEQHSFTSNANLGAGQTCREWAEMLLSDDPLDFGVQKRQARQDAKRPGDFVSYKPPHGADAPWNDPENIERLNMAYAVTGWRIGEEYGLDEPLVFYDDAAQQAVLDAVARVQELPGAAGMARGSIDALLRPFIEDAIRETIAARWRASGRSRLIVRDHAPANIRPVLLDEGEILPKVAPSATDLEAQTSSVEPEAVEDAAPTASKPRDAVGDKRDLNSLGEKNSPTHEPQGHDNAKEDGADAFSDLAGRREKAKRT